MYSRAFLRHMTENLQADGVQSRQTLFVRYCLQFVRCYRILLYHEKSGVAIIFSEFSAKSKFYHFVKIKRKTM